MSHIHTEHGQHDQTASAFIVRTDRGEPRLLLHEHKKLGIYLQFGGHIELDETPWQAVAHEVEEESGYKFHQLRVLQPKNVLRRLPGVKLHPYPVCQLTHAFDDHHNHTDTEYVFTVDDEPMSTVGEGESQTIQAFSQDELASLPHGRIPENVRAIGMFIFDVCLKSWEAMDTAVFEF